MKTRTLLAGLAFAVAIIGTTFQARAAFIAYSNGPTNRTLGCDVIYVVNGTSWSLSNSFTLADSAELNGASVGIYTDEGQYLTSVDWAITNTAFGSVLASGTATSITNNHLDNLGINDVSDASFEIWSPTLAAGTYYFQLSYAVATNGGACWNLSNGPSTVFKSWDDGVSTSQLMDNSNAFTLTAVPEASSACLGLLGATGLLIRRRRGA